MRGSTWTSTSHFNTVSNLTPLFNTHQPQSWQLNPTPKDPPQHLPAPPARTLTCSTSASLRSQQNTPPIPRNPNPPHRLSPEYSPPVQHPADPAFKRSHSSYIQDKSALTRPRILSRTSRRKSLGGGLRRRRSGVYDDHDDHYDGDSGGLGSGGEDAGVARIGEKGQRNARVPTAGLRAAKQIPKAESEAALSQFPGLSLVRS